MHETPQRLRFGEILSASGATVEAELPDDPIEVELSSELQAEPIDLGRTHITPDVASALPLDFVRRNRVLPLALHNGTIRIATADPGNRRVVEDVRLLSGLEVEETVATEADIQEKIAESYGITVERLIEDFDQGDSTAGRTDNLHDIEVMANEPTVVNLVNVILAAAMRERASDIHFVPFEKALELRYRIDGILELRPPPPKHLHAALISRIKIMADMNIAERYIPQDGHIQIQHGGRRVDIRVGTMPTVHGESAVLRLLEKGSRPQSPEELGLDAERAGALRRLTEKPHGIFLATGPTGSGKTTTLYSILSSIHSPEKKIITLEDPVEYELPGVAQIPVRPARGFTFAAGLRAILRQDPDVIMVGEIRDSETAEIAIRAALTGHVVFSTLHTNDAAGAITRLMDMGIEGFLISSSLEGVLAQRLVRRICPACRTEGPISTEMRHKLEALGVDPGPGPHFRGAGCDECRGTGYRGRTGLYELLVVTPELRDMIVARRSSTEIKAAAVKSMVTLREDGLRKAAEGATTLDEILRVALGGLS
jgi:type II secretory ATPase GspE/PulE/Tfp pilus assembly ATPase PilB-like protein